MKHKIQVRTEREISEVKITLTSEWFSEKDLHSNFGQFYIAVPFEVAQQMRRALKQEAAEYAISPRRLKNLQNAKKRRLEALKKAQTELLAQKASDGLHPSRQHILDKVTRRIAAFTQ